MIAEDGRRTVQERDSMATAQRAVLEQRTRLRKLLRGAMAKVEMAVMGAQQPIRPVVNAVHDLVSQHLAEADALIPPARAEDPPFRATRTGRLQAEFAEALAELATLGAWPEEEDELELAIRFQSLATVLLEALVSEERYLLDAFRNEFAVDDPFGC
jgi:hypothetical protein